MNDIRRIDEAFGVISSYGAAKEVFVNELPHRRSRMLFKYSPPPISQYGNLIYGSVASDYSREELTRTRIRHTCLACHCAPNSCQEL